ncbi:MAG: GtrA family protein [Verrucomicrobiaceae bacterium]|nr:GtrA family protein [Verrucomicrobiaceae bacterium]
MASLLTSLFQFLKQNDLKTIIARLNSRDTHPVVQFIKYGLCGVAATLIHTGIVTVLSIWVYPAGKGMLVDGAPLTEALREHNLLLNNTLAFPFGLITAYLTNRLWVFSPGKHHVFMEFLLFAVIGAIGFFPGLLAVKWLAGHLHLPSTVAQLGFVVTSFLVNFVCRKFVIFKG